MVRVKICGIKNTAEALVAISAGAYAIGEVFAPSSRQISVEKAAAINHTLNKQILKVGVFVDEKLDNLKRIYRETNLDIVQLHGNEPPEYVAELDMPVIKAFAVSSRADIDKVRNYQAWAYLFDTKITGQAGGTGIPFDWDLVKSLQVKKLILAGGLNPDNVTTAIGQVKPWAVDVSSGVEDKDGIKDHQKIIEFISKVKEVG
ncbi:MAG: phosphoribosylanthranilate isomerase [Syntrophomonadaceae bacterium]|nr:phosphoribosylanthranilate isomerase [Syntrophomonadaceae bacterium]